MAFYLNSRLAVSVTLPRHIAFLYYSCLGEHLLGEHVTYMNNDFKQKEAVILGSNNSSNFGYYPSFIKGKEHNITELVLGLDFDKFFFFCHHVAHQYLSKNTISPSL